MRDRRPSLLLGSVVLGTSIVIASTAGAVAGSMITGKQIKDGTITTLDIKDRSLKTQDLAPATVARLRGAAGPQGPAGPPGAQGAAGSPGPPGTARGYAWVQADGTVLRSSGNVTATAQSAGLTCVSVSGVSAETSVAVVTLDYSLDATTSSNQSYAEIASGGGGGCPATAFTVVTFSRDANTGTSGGYTQPFFIVVP